MTSSDRSSKRSILRAWRRLCVFTCKSRKRELSLKNHLRDEILPQLKRRYNINGELCFGDIFSSRFIAPFFKIYAEFLSQKELIDMEIHKLRKNTLIGPHVNSIEQKGKILISVVSSNTVGVSDIPELLNGLKVGLNVLLLEPVQRIPRCVSFSLHDVKKLLDTSCYCEIISKD